MGDRSESVYTPLGRILDDAVCHKAVLRRYADVWEGGVLPRTLEVGHQRSEIGRASCRERV